MRLFARTCLYPAKALALDGLYVNPDNAPANYLAPRKSAVLSANAAMQNYVSIQEHQTMPNPALAAVQG
jgi:hypothetical protein